MLQGSVDILKAIAEPTRLRVLVLLAGRELTVKDLTRILGQSQPRISRHLKLLAEAGLVERAPEGSWAYFRLSERGEGAELAASVLGRLATDDPLLVRDRRHAELLLRERDAAAQAYFQSHAAEWDSIRALHIAEADVETAIAGMLGPGPFDVFLDLGTGTGRMLELLADRYRRGLGIDRSTAMLAYARAKLERRGISHAQVRHGDIYDLPVPDLSADAIVMHQVLHFLADPLRAIREAGRVLAPGGRLLIVDFAPHALEYLLERFAHERLGFPPTLLGQWLEDCGLNLMQSRELNPGPGQGSPGLTVSMWLAGRPTETVSAGDLQDRKLERIG
jgi:ArsR family transcriptional regulator